MSYSDAPMINAMSKSDYSQLEKINETYEEMKLLLIIFGSIISILLFFLLNITLIYYCKSQNNRIKNTVLELKQLEPDDDKTTLI